MIYFHHEPITLPVTQTVISGTTTILPEDSITPPLSTLSTPESKQQWIQSFFEPTDEHGNIQPTTIHTGSVHAVTADIYP